MTAPAYATSLTPNLVAFTLLLVPQMLIRLALARSSLIYNTTSGAYEAKLVRVEGVGFDAPRYLHKLVGVPYAENPERFRQSVMRLYRSPPSGIAHRPLEPVVCYQSVNLSSYGLFNLIEAAAMSEDCLTVSLYMPVASAPGDDKLLRNMSVVVHIHGGSNMVGGAALFDGTILAAHGKVVVAIINYRLNMLGFMSDQTAEYPGNYGLKDQLLAIKWLKKNCRVLNCNPESITLWGHSAGAGDVNWLSISPLSSGLFQRAIIQSGSSFSYWGYDKQPSERYKAMKSFFNCSSDLPDYHTRENKAMTRLIKECLTNVSYLSSLLLFSLSLSLL